jgi:hypothetical protein
MTRIAAVLLLLAACAGGDKTGADTQASGGGAADVEQARAAATLANAMAANPSRADSIISAAGYTVESFERLMYEIAADSAQAAAYAAARTD